MSATTVRRFGTEISNIPKDISSKNTPKKTPKKTTIKGDDSRKQVFVQKSPIRAAFVEEIVDDEITVKSSPVKFQAVTDFPCRYERDFLLSFQERCNQPLEGLIAEVRPGFAHPEPEFSSEFSSLNISQVPRSAPSLKGKKAKEEFASPHGGVVFKPFNRSQDSAGSPNRLSVTVPPVSAEEFAPMRQALDFSSPTGVRSQSLPCSPLSDLQPTNLSLEWRVKKIKKTKPRETDARRLAARQKQIDIGVNTPGYLRFMELVPADKRTKDHPRIPDINQVCSKRSWDGQVRKWRRMLHDYDPESAGKALTLDDSDKENETYSDQEDFSDEEINGIESQLTSA